MNEKDETGTHKDKGRRGNREREGRQHQAMRGRKRARKN